MVAHEGPQWAGRPVEGGEDLFQALGIHRHRDPSKLEILSWGRDWLLPQQ
jgi:hypothetical protein